MEGFLLVPPERGTIIGRALWKPRLVTLGARGAMPGQSTLPPSTSTSRLVAAQKTKPASPRTKSSDAAFDASAPYLTIYKFKDELEVVSQHSLLLLKNCEIQSVQHRKGGPTLPTLVISFHPDPTSEKLRKRRSSRTAGVNPSTPGATAGETLLFRTHHTPDEPYNINDWQIVIQRNLVSLRERGSFDVSGHSGGLVFKNPFSLSSSTTSTPRPPTAPSANSIRRPSIPRSATHSHVVESSGYSSLKRIGFGGEQAMISPSPSLKSRRSDVSLQAPSQQPPYAHGNHSPGHPSDLPSPVPTIGTDGLIEGWTSAQGRSSALSNHTRQSASISTRNGASSPYGTTPPAPKESILDRAFQMRYIPGGERYRDGEESDDTTPGKISSIARFEALMRDTEERKARTGMVRTQSSNRHSTVRNKMAMDVTEEASDSGKETFPDTDDSDDDFETGDPDLTLSIREIPTSAQRALEFISGRATPAQRKGSLTQPPVRKNNLPRPEPAPSKMVAPRAHAHTHSATGRPTSMVIPPPRPIAGAPAPRAADADGPMQRQNSTNSRISFNEFTKRLSSTSSLLLVQTNNSSSSASRHSRGNSIHDRASSELSFADNADEVTRGGLRQRNSLGLVIRGERHADHGRDQDLDERELLKKCGWRGSVGVFGEGGFL